jgi:hypothetical protein
MSPEMMAEAATWGFPRPFFGKKATKSDFSLDSEIRICYHTTTLDCIFEKGGLYQYARIA